MNRKSTAFKRGHPTQLPKEYIDRLVQPLSRFFEIEAAAGVVLLCFTLLALYLANSSLSQSFSHLWDTPVGINIGSLVLERTLHDWINDALMTLFFFLIALELKRELVLGELHDSRVAMLSISGAIGGMLVPALVFLFFLSGQPEQHGWGTVMATDTAFVIGCMALLGTRIPKSLRVFMLSLAIVDDLGAIIVVTLGYGHQIDWFAIAFVAVGLLAIKVMALLGVRSITLFFIMGSGIWWAVDASGIHPTVTGVILGLMTPTTKWVSDARLHTIMDCVVAYPRGDHWSGNTLDRKALRTAEAAARETLSPLERLEMLLHPWVGFVVMPVFAFANAGIPITTTDFTTSLTIAVFFGLVLGKPIGVLLFSWIAVKLGLATLPKDLPWPMILGGGILAGIGFTMAMFISNLAYNPEQVNAAKLGILSASLFSGILGLIFLTFFSKRRILLNES